jgi:hypothetical protein
VRVDEAVRVTSGGVDVKVYVLRAYQHLHGAAPLRALPKLGAFVVVQVYVKVDRGRYGVNPLAFIYQAPGGAAVNSVGGNAPYAGYLPVLQPVTLGVGQRANGLVTFDTKPGTAGALVQLLDPQGVVLGAWRL